MTLLTHQRNNNDFLRQVLATSLVQTLSVNVLSLREMGIYLAWTSSYSNNGIEILKYMSLVFGSEKSLLLTISSAQKSMKPHNK